MFKNAILIIPVVLLFAAECSSGTQKRASDPVKIIFDTDLGPDYDDVGALTFLYAMADSGKAVLLATISSNKHPLVAPCINIINTYFGRPEMSIGAPKSEGVSHTAWQHWPDSLVAKYPHTVKSTSEVPDAITIYRKILNSQPDSSVTIVTVGFLTNIANLLKSQPDSLSPLDGRELVAKKVKRLISMAGKFPEGKEFNVFMDSTASEYVFNEWPGEIIFTGFEIGSKIFTGLRLVNSDIRNSPVKDVYRISMPLSNEDKNGRMSWDQTAVLIAVYGTRDFFDIRKGNIIINPDGSNSWEDNSEGIHKHVIQKMPVHEITKFIEDRMMHQSVQH
ncbi:MAG: nucleoside hydrolase [Bacteroidales bacterium]